MSYISTSCGKKRATSTTIGDNLFGQNSQSTFVAIHDVAAHFNGTGIEARASWSRNPTLQPKSRKLEHKVDRSRSTVRKCGACNCVSPTTTNTWPSTKQLVNFRTRSQDIFSSHQETHDPTRSNDQPPSFPRTLPFDRQQTHGSAHCS